MIKKFSLSTKYILIYSQVTNQAKVKPRVLWLGLTRVKISPRAKPVGAEVWAGGERENEQPITGAQVFPQNLLSN
jgi:hypothetical protein